jgi:hypothetical protein
MGYCCPVCELPQADGEHLANHLAITAMTHGDDHEDWLDEHAAGWDESSPEELAEIVVEHAAETNHETVFEDTTERGPRERGRTFEDELSRQLGAQQHGGRGDLTDEADQVLAEAQELTAQMQGEDSTDVDASSSSGDHEDQ